MPCYDAVELRTFAASLLGAAGLAERHAEVTAGSLVDADLLGYTTHGIQFLPQYCAALERGDMTRDGEVRLVADHGATLVYDGIMLPGPCCVRAVLHEMLSRATGHPVVAATIRRSSNTACLATYLLPVVEAGHVGIVMVSSPDGRAVAPAGGREGRYSTNPMAFGFPTGGDPVLIDMATSATTNRLNEKLQREGGSHLGEPLIDESGRPTNDPSAFAANRGGAIRPLGGDTNEHKGYALALAVQAMSAALSAGGGAEAERRPTGSAAYIQIINPRGFTGLQAFRSEMDDLIASLLSTPPRPDGKGVRVPGQRAMAAYRRQADRGVEISAELRSYVEPVAAKYAIAFPAPIAAS